MFGMPECQEMQVKSLTPFSENSLLVVCSHSLMCYCRLCYRCALLGYIVYIHRSRQVANSSLVEVKPPQFVRWWRRSLGHRANLHPSLPAALSNLRHLVSVSAGFVTQDVRSIRVEMRIVREETRRERRVYCIPGAWALDTRSSLRRHMSTW